MLRISVVALDPFPSPGNLHKWLEPSLRPIPLLGQERPLPQLPLLCRGDGHSGSYTSRSHSLCSMGVAPSASIHRTFGSYMMGPGCTTRRYSLAGFPSLSKSPTLESRKHARDHSAQYVSQTGLTVFSTSDTLFEAVFVRNAGVGWSYCGLGCANDFFQFLAVSYQGYEFCVEVCYQLPNIWMAVVVTVVVTATVPRLVTALSKAP